MPYLCFDNTPSFTALLLYNPFFVSVVLLTVGIVTPLLWIKLRGHLRYSALAFLLLCIGFMAAEPVGLKWKMFKAERILKGGDWSSSSRKYAFDSPNGHALAVPISLGSRCSQGFIVKTAGYPLSLDDIYSNSPDLNRRYEYVTYLKSPYHMCFSRLQALYGEENRPDLSRTCSFKQPAVTFSLFRPTHMNPYAFEMEWCRPINRGTFFYCEASKDDVFLADGNKF